jgi:glycine/serine hydroxymethyltransferase
MRRLARVIADVLRAPADEAIRKQAARDVVELTSRYPVPGITDRGAV